ncbi:MULTISPECIES: sigma 54-interacting transcriptional regulator [Rhodopseudomonas]|uniref:Histidine kinase n=1 Tax=Rhodopseudomonas palustris TaxID=1076 RepID=A0A0D7EQ25_RHOPL|nr:MULTISPECIES: sigma 54-interacting transcriptional regulator [Rhodopseudomonas]KIZ42919.1 histidine kinase [Rhodopseudomonas palustris]MDF3810656.1 sigma 54-interacting transcriptional regulator [Rhodopseudomonas sp. BAL398]WOK18449.1 sigma 54-interacting transcriptional regulator [Rhodopseudomonas sp. BAL398]
MDLSGPAALDADAVLRAAAFDAAVEPALLLDPGADRIVDANHAACALLGADRAVLRQTRISALHDGQIPALIVFTQAVQAKRAYWTHALTPRHANGTKLRVEYAGSMVAHDGRDLVLLMMSDLEQRRRRLVDAAAEDYMRSGLATWQRVERVFQDIERENQLILRAAGEGIYGVNAEGKTTFVNPAAERILGWSAEELVGQEMHAMVHHSHHDGRHYPGQDCPIYAAFRDGAIHNVDGEVFWRKDGSAAWVEYTSTPIRDRGIVVGAVVVFRDVSQRHEADEKLHAALAEVDRLSERLQLENAYLQEEIRIETNPRGIIGQSEAIQKTLQQVTLVAPTTAAVMITGESGTGKELIARAIHEASARRDRPLIRVNCAAIPRELFESEFFGHARGAFTGAVRDRIGRFELADGGTLFLDEVGEIPLELQGKLLRVLQEGNFERVGEERTRKVDVRLIAATNRNLKQEVARGRFREDLYFRLNVFPIESVPLRERREDIPLLAQHFLSSENKELKSGLRLSQGDARRLARYDWPGNVRELQNVIERATILAQNGRLRIDLPETPGGHPAPGTNRHKGDAAPAVMTVSELRDLERANILAALRACKGKVFGDDGAAAMLDIKPTTLASRIKALGIAAPRPTH